MKKHLRAPELDSRIYLGVIAFLSLGLVALYANLTSLYDRYSTLTAEYSRLSAEYNALLSDYNDLNHHYYLLQQEHNNLERLYNDLQRVYNSLLSDYNFAIGELNKCSFRVSFVYEWMTSSVSYYENTGWDEKVRPFLIGDYLDYPSLIFARGYRYIEEGNVEHIESPSEFEENRGGDCEDWAAFFRGLVLWARDEGYGLYLARDEPGSIYLLYGGYYYDNSDVYRIEPFEIKDVYIVCGDVDDYNSPGHCVDYIEFFNGDGIYVEPQTGFVISDPFLPSKEGGPCTGEWFRCSFSSCYVCGVNIYDLLPGDTVLNTTTVTIETWRR